MTKTNVHIGGSFAETKHRVLDAVARYQSGESQGGERHLTFDDLETFMKVFTPKRVELVRHAKHHSFRSVRALATALGRDYSNVHADVAELSHYGVLTVDKTHGVQVACDEVQARIVL